MSDKDIREFFKQVDLYESDVPVKSFERLATEYKVLFRLIYCCGLRNNKASTLRLADVDTDSGTLTIIHSKGNKDRIVHLADDVCQVSYASNTNNDWGKNCQTHADGSFLANIRINVSRKQTLEIHTSFSEMR